MHFFFQISSSLLFFLSFFFFFRRSISKWCMTMNSPLISLHVRRSDIHPSTIRTAKPNIMDGFRHTKGSSQAIPQISVSRTCCLFSKLIEMKTGCGGGGCFMIGFQPNLKTSFSLKTTDTPWLTLQGLFIANSFRCSVVRFNLPPKSGAPHLS